MVMYLKYLCRVEISTALKHIRRGYITMSNNDCKTFRAHENSRGKMSIGLDANTENAVESCTLSNGIRLVCESRCCYTTTLGCFFPAGAMHELPEERGSALFLEHLLFRRTTRRNEEEMIKVVEEIGAKITTVATRDMFLFYGTVPSKEIVKLIDIFADVIMNNLICDQDIAREKCVILHDLSKMESDKERVVMDYLPTIAYQDTDLANSIYPETDVIKKFCKARLVEFQDRLFKPCSLTIVCTGPICLAELEKIVCKYGGSYSSSAQSSRGQREYRFSGAELRYRDDDHELGYVAIGVEGPSSKESTDYYALNVAKEIVGCWDRTSSGGAQHNAPYLAHCAFNTVLCRMYKSFFQNWAQSTSIWGCYFVCDKLSLTIMTSFLQKEWMRLCTTITGKETSRAVNRCKTRELLLLNDPVDHLIDIVQNYSRYGSYIPIHERIKEYEKITADIIREASVKYIYNQSPAVIAYGRIENFPDYCNIKNSIFVPTKEANESNMVVMEVSLPSGFTADRDSLPSLEVSQNVKRVETKEGDTVVVLYFDKMDRREYCPTVSAFRTHKVAKQKPVPVTIYDYYDSSRKARVFYEPRKATLCDLCKEEDCEDLCVSQLGKQKDSSQSAASYLTTCTYLQLLLVLFSVEYFGYFYL